MIEPELNITFRTERNLSLDFIRGIAVLGMIFINILVFIPEINNPTWLEAGSVESSIYKVIYVLFNGKMRALFALLFGAGIISFFNSSSAQYDYYPRRMLWLLIFGLLHAYLLLWPGSILFEYAACGLLLFTLRSLKPYTLLSLSIVILGFYTWLNSGDYSISHQKYEAYCDALNMENAGQALPEDLKKKKISFEHTLADYHPLSQAKKDEMKTERQEKITLYTGDLSRIYKQNLQVSNEALSYGVFLNILESLGTMLLGMALFSMGFFSSGFRSSIYPAIAFSGIAIGVTLYLLLYSWQPHTKDELMALHKWKTFSSFGVESVARIILSLGYCALGIWLCSLKSLTHILIPVAHTGRMAFSNYISQTLICVIIFYGLGYYGRLNLSEIAVIALAIILLQLIVSSLCIQKFKTGPLEYAWRKLSLKNLPESHSAK